MPEVVYAYSLKDAIANEYLKQPRYEVYQGEIKSNDFVRTVIKDFWNNEGTTRREGMLPKLAFFGSTIDEVRDELRPAIEGILTELNIPTDRVLVNVGDDKLTTNEDIREFIQLDTERSEKQFIVLVGKGREGWNCRSLFEVALYREPRSKIFVLQSTMRCLRSIGDIQETGHIYLSEANGDILEAELQQNFRVTRAELERKNSESETVVVDITAVPPPVILKLARERVLYDTKRRPKADEVDFGLSDERIDQYRVTVTTHRALNETAIQTREITSELIQREFTGYTLTAELARYFQFDGVSPFEIEQAIETSKGGPERVLLAANLNNRIVYEVLIPALFKAFFKMRIHSRRLRSRMWNSSEAITTRLICCRRFGFAPRSIFSQNAIILSTCLQRTRPSIWMHTALTANQSTNFSREFSHSMMLRKFTSPACSSTASQDSRSIILIPILIR